MLTWEYNMAFVLLLAVNEDTGTDTGQGHTCSTSPDGGTLLAELEDIELTKRQV
jgi:hypothetical protein